MPNANVMSTTTTDRVVVGSHDGLHVIGQEQDTHLFEGTAVTAACSDGGVIWALTERRHLYRCDGDQIERVASLDRPVGTCLASHRDTLWVGGDDAGLWRLEDSTLEVVDSFQHAPTRDEWSTPWGGPPSVFSIADNGSEVYVSVHVGGIMRSSDQGRSWNSTIDLHDDVHQVAIGPDGAVWAATGRRGLAASNDRGETWRYHTAGLHATYLLAVAAGSSGVFVAASSGHAAADGALYRFEVDRFVDCTPQQLTVDGAIGPRQVAAVNDHVVVAMPNGDVYTSTDAGRSWNRAARDLSDVTEVRFAAHSAALE